MSPEAVDLAALVALIIAGPWGLVLMVALVRGYSITLRLRRRHRVRARTVGRMSDTDPTVVPAVAPAVVEPEPPARVDPDDDEGTGDADDADNLSGEGYKGHTP